jgi:hypothetical protein
LPGAFAFASATGVPFASGLTTNSVAVGSESALHVLDGGVAAHVD